MSTYSWSVEWAREAHVRTLARLQTTSTNADAKEQLSMLGHRSLVIAEHQTAGRGRGDHVWTDVSGQALLSSWIFQSEKSPQPVLSALIGLALYESAQKTWPKIDWALRAPNDLHIVDSKSSIVKKIAGLLIEVVSTGAMPGSTSSGNHVIVGLGMNLTGAPTGTTPYRATYLAAELAAQGQTLTEEDWSRFLDTWLERCEASVKSGTAPELKQTAQKALLAGLVMHPEFHDLEEVRSDGSLIFKTGRITHWAEL